MRQRWAGLLFLHWRVDPALVQARLPAGLQVDTFDGAAWLGVVPFFMDRVRPAGFPPVPWLSWFMELNVRTYVHDAAGNAGVWFFSLDCNQPAAVEIARRAFQLPYEHAEMWNRRNGRKIEYHSRRKCAGAPDAAFEYDTPVVTRPADEGSLEWFLVERYLLFAAARDGTLSSGRVHHAPYQLGPVRCDRWSTEPLRLNGFDEPPGEPDRVIGAATVDVTIFPLQKQR